MPRFRWIRHARDPWSGWTFSVTFGRSVVRTFSAQWGGR